MCASTSVIFTPGPTLHSDTNPPLTFTCFTHAQYDQAPPHDQAFANNLALARDVNLHEFTHSKFMVGGRSKKVYSGTSL